MTLEKFRLYFNSKLENTYTFTELDAIYKILIAHVLKFTAVDIVLKKNQPIPIESVKTLKNSISLLQKETPIQYITGNTFFYNSQLKVTPDTLIPRPETEELVDWIIRDFKNKQKKELKILDIGTGSGAIAISLAKALPNASVEALDVSEKALRIAKLNSKENNLTIRFYKKNILNTKHLDMNYDIIVSNPPYVRLLEKKEINNNVLQYEPHTALFVTNQAPLLFYSKITELALKHLNPKGVLYFEINQYLGKETLNLIKTKGFQNIELKQDFKKNDRMIKAVIP